MRKLVLSTALAMGLLLILGAAVALANNGPHGGYTSSTQDEDACAGCHRAHGDNARLLVASTTVGVCVSCHGMDALDVFNGYVGPGLGNMGATDATLAATPLNGGAFLNGATSVHQVEGLATIDPAMLTTNASESITGTLTTYSDTVTIVPDSTGKTLVRSLTCVSCHDPHGRVWDSTGTNLLFDYGSSGQGSEDNANNTIPAGAIEQFRMLTGFNGQSETVVVTGTGNIAGAKTATDYSTPQYGNNTVGFCVSCHDQNLQGVDGDGTLNSWVGVAKHPVNVPLSAYTQNIADRVLTTTLPLESLIPGGQDGTANADPNAKVVCLTCHRAHGTSVGLPTGDAAGDEMIDYAIGKGVYQYNNGNMTFLLRMQSRGVCEDCHKK